jgi:nucleotide-binding universal stress UspA family protein
MDPKYVLIFLASTEGAKQCLDNGAAVAERLGLPLRLAHVQIGAGSIVLPSQEQLSEYEAEHLGEFEQKQTQSLREIVKEWAHARGIDAPFDLFEGDEWHVMRRYRSKARLVVLASPHTQPLGHRDVLRAALLRSGHPVVMIPPQWTGAFGARLLVGWEDVAPLRRSLTAFSPFLSAASHVEVVAVNQEEAGLETAREALGAIAPHAVYRRLDGEGRRTADVLLDEARKTGSDGIVMGAFRRGEILNWLIPGTSSRLIQDSFVPLLMSS